MSLINLISRYIEENGLTYADAKYIGQLNTAIIGVNAEPANIDADHIYAEHWQSHRRISVINATEIVGISEEQLKIK